MKTYLDIHARYSTIPGPCWFKMFDPTKSVFNYESGIEYYMHTWKDLFHEMEFMYRRSLEVPTLGGLQVRTGVLPDSSHATDRDGTPAATVLTWTFGRMRNPDAVKLRSFFRPTILSKRVEYYNALSLPTNTPFPSPHSAYGVSVVRAYSQIYEKFMHDAEIPSWFFIPDGLTDTYGWCPPLRYSDKRWRYALGETPEHMDKLYGRPPLTTTSWEDLL